jgi:two-component system chemotaxis response regulator CheY
MSFFKKEDAKPYDLSNLGVLLVEDSAYMQSLMTSMLKVFGVGEIMACSNGQEAIDLLKVTQARRKSRYIMDIDIVVTDWLMPKVSGEELIKWIRSQKDDATRFLPILVVSAYTTEKVVSLARDCGANETLVKPISGKSLASRICNIIDHPRPFVSTPTYFGPDRRRQNVSYKGVERRIIVPEHIHVAPDKTEGAD